MNKSIVLLILTVFLISCGKDVKISTLSELNKEKTTLIGKIDSLNDKLKKVEKQISKLDTARKHQIITAIPVKNDVFKHYIEIQGVVKSDKNIEIRPELGAVVKAIYVTEGQRVRRGQTIIQLDDSAIQNSITELKTQLTLAITTYERQERLWNQKIGSEMQFLQAKAQKEGLENSLKSLKTQERKMKITAPFSGVIDEIFPKKGELTGPQNSVVRLINLDKVYVEADVTETYLPIVKVGTETILNFPSVHKEVEAKITQIGNYINPDNRSFKTRINLANSDHSIKPNLLADLKIMDFKKKGIIIPSTLVQKDQNGLDFVFTTVTEDGESKIAKKLITVEKEYNHEVFVSDGLSENDQLVNEGARLVKVGDVVNISKQ